MTRFLILDRPSCAPHFDLINRDTAPGQVFDLGVDLEGYDGSVFIKVNDIKEMARSLGMLSAEDAKLITDENKRLQRMVDNLPEQAEVLKSELDRVVSAFHSSLSGGTIADSSENDSEDDGESSSGTKQNDEPDLLSLLEDK